MMAAIGCDTFGAANCSCICCMPSLAAKKNAASLRRFLVLVGRARSLRLPAIASAATAAVAAAATAAAATTTRSLRFGFVDFDLPAVERSAIQLLNGSLRFGVARHLDEAEAFALTGITIADDGDRSDRAAFAERIAHALFGHGIRQVADVEFSAHGYLPR